MGPAYEKGVPLLGVPEKSPYPLPETNIAPENRPPQWESSIPTIHF